MSYASKKKDLASKGMPDPKVGRNVKSGDKKAELPIDRYMKNRSDARASGKHVIY